MALDFPNSPAANQTFTGPNGIVWQWDGAKWITATTAGAYATLKDPILTGNPQTPTPSPGDADQTIANTAFVAASTATALTNVGRNLIHNGLFTVAQRGTGGFVAAGYNLDRWVASTTLDVIGFAQVPIGDAGRTQIGDEAAGLCLSNVFTGNAGATASNCVTQRIENMRRLSGKTVIVSFWAQCATGLKLGVSLDQWFGTGGSPSAPGYVNGNGQATPALTGTWTRFSFTFTLPGTTGLTLGTNKDDYTALNIWYSAGANSATRAGNIGVQTGTVTLWGVQLEIGSVATPLEKRDPVLELQQAQRFYQTGQAAFSGWAGAAITVYTTAYFPVAMRGSPVTVTTVTNSNSNAGTTSWSVLANLAGVSLIGATTGATAYALNSTYTASADL